MGHRVDIRGLYGAGGLRATDIKRLKSIDIKGLVVNNPAEAAAIFSTFRDPRFEVFNKIFTDKDGKIIKHSAISSGLPSRARVSAVANDYSSIEKELKKELAETKAAHIWIAHNHPSGSVEASDPDIAITQVYEDTLGEVFSGHIILDHDKYAFLKNDENQVIELKTPLENFLPESISGLNSSEAIANIFSKTMNDNEPSTVIGFLDSAHRLISWDYIAPATKMWELKNTVISTGATKAVIITNDSSQFSHYRYRMADTRGTDNDILLDVIEANGGNVKSVAKDSGKAGGRWVNYTDNKTIIVREPDTEYTAFSEKNAILKQIADPAEKALFQLTEGEIAADAQGYESWEAWRDASEAALYKFEIDDEGEVVIGVAPEGELTPEETDEWYKSRWERAHVEPEPDKGIKTSELDRRFLQTIDKDFDHFREQIEVTQKNIEGAEDRDEAAELAGKVQQLAHPLFWVGSDKAWGVRNVKESSKKTLLTHIRNNPTQYRMLYAMLNSESELAGYAAREVYDKPFMHRAIEQGEGLSAQKIGELAQRLQSDDVRARVERREETSEEIIAVVKTADADIAELKAGTKALEAMLEKTKSQLDSSEEFKENFYERKKEAERKLKKAEKRLVDLEVQKYNKGERDKASVEWKIAKENEKAQALREQIAHLKQDVKIQQYGQKLSEKELNELQDWIIEQAKHTAKELKINIEWNNAEHRLAAQMAVGKMKAQTIRKQRERAAAAQFLAERKKLAARILTPPSSSIDLKYQQQIIAVQQAFLQGANPVKKGTKITYQGDTMPIEELITHSLSRVQFIFLGKFPKV
jgi:DNA repair protein RadC